MPYLHHSQWNYLIGCFVHHLHHFSSLDTLEWALDVGNVAFTISYDASEWLPKVNACGGIVLVLNVNRGGPVQREVREATRGERTRNLTREITPKPKRLLRDVTHQTAMTSRISVVKPNFLPTATRTDAGTRGRDVTRKHKGSDYPPVVPSSGKSQSRNSFTTLDKQ